MSEGQIVESKTIDKLFANPRTSTHKLIGSEPGGVPNPISDSAEKILEVDDLKVWFPIQKGILKRTIGHIKAVDGIAFLSIWRNLGRSG